ncbi:MAG: glycoside hydrolase family 18 protein [Oscillospiraceae bacterium]
MGKLFSAIMAIVMTIMTAFGVNPATTLGRAKSVDLSNLKDLPNIAAQSQVLHNNSTEAVTSLSDNNGLTMLKLQKGDSIFMNFTNDVTFNTIVIEELSDKKGPSATKFEGGTKQFSIYAQKNGQYELIYQNDKIDEYRLCTFDTVTTKSIKIVFDDCRDNATVKEISIYQVGKTKTNFRVNDYFVANKDKNYSLDLEFIGYLKTVTDITLFGGVYIGKDGTIQFRDGNEEAFANQLKQIKTAIKLSGQDTKIYCNVFSGDEPASFFQDKTSTIAKNISAFLVKYDLQGADIDWEYPEAKEDWVAYNQLVLDIRKEFDTVGKKLSLAVAVWNVNFSKAAMEAVDYYNVMLYDLSGDDFDSYHSSFRSTTGAIETMIKKGYTREKICLGFPFYGREVPKYNPGCEATWPSYRGCGFETKWENVQYKTDANGVKSPLYYFNGYAMIADKTAYAISMSLGGVMTWHMESDLPAYKELSLHRAMNETVKERVEK